MPLKSKQAQKPDADAQTHSASAGTGPSLMVWVGFSKPHVEKPDGPQANWCVSAQIRWIDCNMGNPGESQSSGTHCAGGLEQTMIKLFLYSLLVFQQSFSSTNKTILIS